MKTKLAGVFQVNQKLLLLVCVLPLLVFAGCASQYDCYTCGKVSCSYCPPKPLPSLSFESCECNDSIGQAYAASLSAQSVGESVPDYYLISNPDFGADGPEANSNGNVPGEDSSTQNADK